MHLKQAHARPSILTPSFSICDHRVRGSRFCPNRSRVPALLLGTSLLLKSPMMPSSSRSTFFVIAMLLLVFPEADAAVMIVVACGIHVYNGQR